MSLVSQQFRPACPSEGQTHEASVGPAVLRVTQQDVARAAGVHNSTVSLALRGSPTISRATGERVRRIAASMGYAPDPAVQALVAYRNRVVGRRSGAAIAVITNAASEFGWKAQPALATCYRGAEERAAELGFSLAHFWAGESGLSQRRLNQILFHRSISGVIFLTSGPGTQSWEGLKWDRLSGVAIGACEVAPLIHRVTTDPVGNLRLAFRRARDAEYRRIGVVLPHVHDEMCDGGWSQALAAEYARIGDADAVPALILHGHEHRRAERGEGGPSEVEAGRFAQWIGCHRPDVLLGWLSCTQPYLASLGMTVPQDIAFLDLDRMDADAGVAGVCQNHRAAGAIAVERVVQLLHQNTRGAPAIPTRTLVEGVWCDGATMPRPESASVLGQRVRHEASEMLGASIA